MRRAKYQSTALVLILAAILTAASLPAQAASTYTTCELFTKPTPGDSATANTWGSLLNTDFDMADQALSGILALSVAGNSNVVLTSSAGAVDQSRNRHFTFAGTLTGNITVFWPMGLCRDFVVTNATSGAFTLTLAVNNGSGSPAGTTQVTAQGGTQLFWSDGTNVNASTGGTAAQAGGDATGPLSNLQVVSTHLAAPLPAAQGGTGVNNGTSTLTLGGALTTTGAATPTLAFGATGYVFTMPLATSTIAALSVSQIWSALQIYANGDFAMLGTGTGYTTDTSANTTATNYTLIKPAANDTYALVGLAQTLTNKTLTSPVISGGTVDNAAIGGTTPAAAKVTTLSASGAVTLTGLSGGTVAEAVCQASGGGLITVAGANCYASAVSAAPVTGSVRNLKANLATAGAAVAFTADQIEVATALNGTPYLLPSYSQTLTTSGTGAGGMDTGSLPTSSYIAVYAIYNPGGPTTSILACAVTESGCGNTVYGGSNLPVGYTASALIGFWPTNATPALVTGYVLDRKFWYRSGGFVATSSLLGTSGTLTSVSLSGAIPAAAKTVDGLYGKITANGLDGQISGFSDGTASQQSTGVSQSGTTLNGYQVVMTFLGVPMITAQTIYYAEMDGGTGQLSITAFTW